MLKDYYTYQREESTEFMKNEGILYAVLKKYGLYNKRDDYIDLCYIGYVKAINKYDETKGTLTNYIYNCVENELLTELRKERAIKRQRMECSTDQLLNDSGFTIYDIVSESDNIEDNLVEKEINAELYKAIENLDETEKFIIINSFGFSDKKYTQAEISKILNKNQAQISRIKERALKKLKDMLGDI